LPDWKYSSAEQYLQYDLLSHIACFDFTVSAVDGSIGNPSGWPWTSIINDAHTNGVKMIMCVVEFNNDDIHTIITDSTVKSNFIKNVESKINTYNLDGVNIDFEGLHSNDRANNINPFMGELTDYIHTNIGNEQEVSFAGPAVNWESWDLPGLADSCDYIFVMAYDYFGSWSATAGPTSPLEGGSYNVTNSVTNTSSGYGTVTQNNPEKIILGVPYYGDQWATEDDNEGSNTEGDFHHPYYDSAVDTFVNNGKNWSSNYKVSWSTWQDGTQWHQMWCDDDSSLGLKYDLAKENNLKGVGMWALGYDNDRDELWDMIREKFYISQDDTVLDDFEISVGHFDKDPNYSGSTHGIDASSTSARSTSESHNSSTASLEIILKDDVFSSENWQVRLLSGTGSASNNIELDTSGAITLWLKTSSANTNAEIAIALDDKADGMELSKKISINNDGNWHRYGFEFQESGWSSFAGGNGSIDGPSVSLDAIFFYADNNSPDWTIYIDDVEYVTNLENYIDINVKIFLEGAYR
ncbi:MAG: glycosyl hydrolase family 18 protein, partial [Candidatus Marinimicrobia bacterium]|nr:glycosyl hydrolase family 18 protein [Candidatus Neomarinimicrobiota bacterium]